MSLQDRIEKLKTTAMSQIKLQKQQLKLYERLSNTEIIDELHQCAVKFTSTLTKKDLMGILSYEIAWNILYSGASLFTRKRKKHN